MRHIISVLLENEPGALSRVSGLFSARGYNIESLTVAPTEDATMSRMTLVTVGSDDVIEQITKQLNKLVEVVKVIDLTEGNHIERELMLVKVRAAGDTRARVLEFCEVFRVRVADACGSQEWRGADAPGGERGANSEVDQSSLLCSQNWSASPRAAAGW